MNAWANLYLLGQPNTCQPACRTGLTAAVCVQAVARQQRTEAAGVPEVPQAVLRQGRAGG